MDIELRLLMLKFASVLQLKKRTALSTGLKLANEPCWLSVLDFLALSYQPMSSSRDSASKPAGVVPLMIFRHQLMLVIKDGSIGNQLSMIDWCIWSASLPSLQRAPTNFLLLMAMLLMYPRNLWNTVEIIALFPSAFLLIPCTLYSHWMSAFLHLLPSLQTMPLWIQYVWSCWYY